VSPLIGVLSLQGDVRQHREMLEASGARTLAVRRPSELDEVDGIVLPGGESTTVAKLARIFGVLDPLRERVRAGLPAFGTCAGMIVCDDAHLGLIDATAARNAFGRQLQSFEADLEVEGIGDESLRAVFIRAPWIERTGPSVEILASYQGHPVAIREGGVLACAFHPELTDDSRLHAFFMAMTTSARKSVREEAEA